MNYAESGPYPSPWGTIAAKADVDERTDFIRKTYIHLLCAILAFAGLEAVLLNTNLGMTMMQSIFSAGRAGPIILLVGFCAVAWIANYWAMNATSKPLQYAGLSLYVVAEAIIFLPMLAYANGAPQFAGQQLIQTAGTITLVMFGGLTAFVLISKKDFSFLGGFLTIAGLAVFGLALCSMIFGFHLGMLYTIGVIVLACGYILYDTSNVLHHYRIGQHVAASLALFASVALLFYYVLRLLMELSSRNR